MLAVLQVFYACVIAQPGRICLMLIMHNAARGGSRDSKGGAQSEIYMHNYSKYIMFIGSFLERFLNLAWLHK